ncbi:MAG TPA: type II and III secretion system protein family protein [Caulobacteraceae bacterium]|nr:type II and III secretion system protein family protein [Caulobacteraceae bacterium]
MLHTQLFAKLVAGLAACACLCALPLVARAGDEAGSVVKVDLGAGAASQLLALPEGRSAIVDLPVDARDVLVSNPAVASAVLRTPRRIFVVGGKSGVTDAVFFDASGRRILALTIRVDINTAAVADTINRVIPGAQVQVEPIADSLILSGVVASASDADKAVAIAKAAVGNVSAQVVNLLSIAGKDQVMLKVRVVEMDREVIKQLGINWQAVVNEAGSPQFALSTVSTYGINGSLLGGLSTTGAAQNKSGSNSLAGNLQAFERVGLVRTLAEPNLTAVSGESAKFLVGGEFPVPGGIANNGQVSVEFKPYGVGLGFTPVVLSGGRISLKLATEVSEISNQGSFDVSAGTGTSGTGCGSSGTGSSGTGSSGSTGSDCTNGATLVIPALTVRRAETTVELPSGGSMMIAGLLQDKTSEDLDSLPGVHNLPILGALLGSRDYQSGQTELVIIVTPYIVGPTSPANLQTPIDGLRIASDADTLLLGRLNETYKHAPEATAGRTYQGPYGYVVE